ncbi:MAG: hypothetical protein HY289_00190 [Planctomycetes bacterium]|nr:hypothetical protein [Planctomycetota bacterium]
MGFLWREWNDGNKAGVSGWDTGAGSGWAPIGATFGFGLAGVGLVAFGLPWIWVILTFVAGLIVSSAFRYHLVIAPDGYHLWRTCCFVPWSISAFSKRASVFFGDSWCEDELLHIGDPCDLNDQQRLSTADLGQPIMTAFGSSWQGDLVAYRIRCLAFQIGCRETPPGEDPTVPKEIKPAVPTMTRRMKWRQRWKKTNDKK